MSDLTYINKDLVMEGTLEAKDSQVIIAGRFKGNIVAKTVSSSNIFVQKIHKFQLQISRCN